jgi:hemerythrin superfamily protein
MAMDSPVKRRAKAVDAIALLKADHRQVEKWFAEFKRARTSERKLTLAREICAALRVHTSIEEEIFYAAFLDACDDRDTHHEAVLEHEGAKKLVADIEGSDGGDEWFEPRMSVLEEMIKHHVKEEEGAGGMFSEARKSGMDLKQLGDRLRARKQELQAQE